MEDADLSEQDLRVSLSRLISYYAVYDGHSRRDCVDFIRARLHQAFASALQAEKLDATSDVHALLNKVISEQCLLVDRQFRVLFCCKRGLPTPKMHAETDDDIREAMGTLQIGGSSGSSAGAVGAVGGGEHGGTSGGDGLGGTGENQTTAVSNSNSDGAGSAQPTTNDFTGTPAVGEQDEAGSPPRTGTSVNLDGSPASPAEVLPLEGTSGCASVFAFIVGSHIYVGNIGDSRAVLSRSGLALDLSYDQRPDRDDERARIQEMGGFVSFARVLGRLAVSRAFGDFEYKIFDPTLAQLKGPLIIAEPEIRWGSSFGG